MDELEMKQNEEQTQEVVDTEVPLDKNLKLMSPGMMVVRRFFRSKLSIVGLVMVIGLFLFSFLGPVLIADTTADYSDAGKWGETELDRSGKIEYSVNETTFTVNGEHLTEYLADVDDAGDYKPETNVIKTENGVTFFDESANRSAPYFDIRIDGITEVQ